MAADGGGFMSFKPLDMDSKFGGAFGGVKGSLNLVGAICSGLNCVLCICALAFPVSDECHLRK